MSSDSAFITELTTQGYRISSDGTKKNLFMKGGHIIMFIS